jgi:hypothetical protein
MISDRIVKKRKITPLCRKTAKLIRDYEKTLGLQNMTMKQLQQLYLCARISYTKSNAEFKLKI